MNKKLKTKKQLNRKTKTKTTSNRQPLTKFLAQNKYADVEYTVNKSKTKLYITVRFKDLKEASAVHIHANNNGMPGPILAWLATSPEWKAGVKQNTPGTNLPCSSVKNPLCNLIAPLNTKNVKELSNKTIKLTITKDFCNDKCNWIEQGTLLDIHGYNFQRIEHGCLTNGKPGLDLIMNTPFECISN